MIERKSGYAKPSKLEIIIYTLQESFKKKKNYFL